MQCPSSGVRCRLSLLLFALSRALPDLGMVSRVYPSRLPLVSRGSQAARCPAPMPSYAPTIVPSRRFCKQHRVFQLPQSAAARLVDANFVSFASALRRKLTRSVASPLHTEPASLGFCVVPLLHTPSFPPFFGKKGRPARRGHVPPPPSGGVPSSSPAASKLSSRRSGTSALPCHACALRRGQVVFAASQAQPLPCHARIGRTPRQNKLLRCGQIHPALRASLGFAHPFRAYSAGAAMLALLSKKRRKAALFLIFSLIR